MVASPGPCRPTPSGPAVRSPFSAGSLRRALVAAVLCLGLLLTGVAPAMAAALTGNYVEDTVSVARSLQSTISLAPDDPSRSAAEVEARALMNGYVARYRPRRAVNGLGSFTTMQTALNSLAGHYAGYPNRPLPEALRTRLEKELRQAESAVVRGS